MVAFIRRLLFVYLRPYRLRCLLLLGGIVLVVAFDILFPLSIKFIIDLAITPQNATIFVMLVGGLTLLYLTASLATPGVDYLMIWLTVRVLNDLRRRMYGHLNALSTGTHQQLDSGEVLNRFGNDLATMEYGFYYAVVPGIQHVLLLFAGALVLFELDWRLAILTVFLLPLPLFAPRRTISAATSATYRRRGSESVIIGAVQEALSAHATTRAFGLADHNLDVFDRRLARYAQETVHADFLQWFAFRITNAGQYLVQLLVIAVGGYLALQGQLSVGSLVGFTSLLYTLGASLTNVSNAIAALIPTVTSSDRIEALLAEPVTITDTLDAPPLDRLRRAITFDHVTFGYPGQERLQLRDVSLAIPSGQSVALVGRSGSGKSTLLNLLQRNYDPHGGQVLLDDCNIAAVKLSSLREQMGLVSQDNFLFNLTVVENIRLGRLGASDSEIVEAARAAGVHDVILGLPDGYGTLVGERGGRLSGGQRQRIALARALIRRPAILLLDEATSALDPESEAAIYETLRGLAGRCTILAVTHRLAPIAYMDQIIVLDHGQVAEQGSHVQLMAYGGIYQQLYAQQAGFSISGNGQQGTIQAARLRGIPLFSEIDQESLTRLAGLFVAEPVAAGQPIFHRGDVGHKFYIIARGKVAVTIPGSEGEHKRLDVWQDGDYFGEIALLEGVPRTATVETLQPSLFLTLDRQHFVSMMAEFSVVREAVERAAAVRRLNLASAASA